MRAQITIIHGGKAYAGEVELVSSGARRTTPTVVQKVVEQVAPTKPSEAIGQLYEKGFFKSPRTLADTMRQLSEGEYNFGKPSVLMVLQRANFLRRTGAKGSSAFVQKYPPAARAK